MIKYKFIIIVILGLSTILGILIIPKYLKKDSISTEKLIKVDNNIPDDYYSIFITEKEKKLKKKKLKEKKERERKQKEKEKKEKQKHIEPKKVDFKFIQDKEVNKDEVKRQRILSALTTASFSSNTKVITKMEFDDIEDYETKKSKIIDPYLRAKDFGLKKNMASKRVDLTRTITADNMFSIILITAINSHLKGKILAMIENDVYASHGSNILIPKGSKAIGWYVPLKKLGIERLGISWTRIITPAGVSINLKANSADVMGRSGAMGELDNRYFARYGLALSISTASNAISYIALKNTKTNDDGTVSAEDTTRNEIVKDYKDDITNMTSQILNEQMKIKPTINIEAGSRMFIFPVADIWFPQAENNNINVQLIKQLKNKKDKKR